MKKIKIFLASSEELKNENLELSDLVVHLNLILVPQDIHIYLEKWEYLEGNRDEEIEKKYTDKLEESDICMIVFGKDFGSYTEKELKKAYERVCKEGVNPSKLYVYFKNIDDLTADLKKFRDSFPDVFGQFSGKFSDVNTLKNDFLLQFQLFQNQNLQNICPVEVKDSKVTVFGKDLFIDFSSLPFVSNMKRLNEIKSNLANIDILLSRVSQDSPLYAVKSEERIKELEEKEKIEKTLWETALKVTEFKEHNISERLKRAIELFEAGELKRVLEILDGEEIKKEAEENLRNLREGRLRKQESIDMMIDGQSKIEEGEEGLKKTIKKL